MEIFLWVPVRKPFVLMSTSDISVLCACFKYVPGDFIMHLSSVLICGLDSCLD